MGRNSHVVERRGCDLQRGLNRASRCPTTDDAQRPRCSLDNSHTNRSSRPPVAPRARAANGSASSNSGRGHRDQVAPACPPSWRLQMPDATVQRTETRTRNTGRGSGARTDGADLATFGVERVGLRRHRSEGNAPEWSCRGSCRFHVRFRPEKNASLPFAALLEG